MNRSSIRKAFLDVYNNNPNFMTPTIIKYGQKQPFIWELSTGRGIFNQRIYGVTILEIDPNSEQGYKERHDLNQLFEDQESAVHYVKNMH